MMEGCTHPVLQASLSMLTESAVMTNASAQARWPMWGFGSEATPIIGVDYHIGIIILNYDYKTHMKKYF